MVFFKKIPQNLLEKLFFLGKENLNKSDLFSYFRKNYKNLRLFFNAKIRHPYLSKPLFPSFKGVPQFFLAFFLGKSHINLLFNGFPKPVSRFSSRIPPKNNQSNDKYSQNTMNKLKKDSKEFAAKLILNEDHKKPSVSIKNVLIKLLNVLFSISVPRFTRSALLRTGRRTWFRGKNR